MIKFTQDEIQKIAFTVKALQWGSDLIGKLPAFTKAVQSGMQHVGLSSGNAFKARMIGGAIGGIGGAATTEDQNPETRTRSMLFRGAVGATAGALTGGFLANKGSNFGNKYTAALDPFNKDLKSLISSSEIGGARITDGHRLQRVSNLAVKHFTPQVTEMAAGNGIKAKTFFGTTQEATGTVTRGAELPSLLHGVGEVAKGAQNIGKHGVIGGTFKTVKDNFIDNTKFIDKVKDPATGEMAHYQFNRSGLGKVVAPLAMSGVGMGLTDAAFASNEDGSKPTMMKRLGEGAKSTLTWGMAPRLMMAKGMAYDIPKTMMGGHKQPQLDTTNNIGA